MSIKPIKPQKSLFSMLKMQATKPKDIKATKPKDNKANNNPDSFSTINPRKSILGGNKIAQFVAHHDPHLLENNTGSISNWDFTSPDSSQLEPPQQKASNTVPKHLKPKNLNDPILDADKDDPFQLESGKNSAWDFTQDS